MIEVRPVEEDAFRPWAALIVDTFGGDGEDPSDLGQARAEVDLDLDRALGAYEGSLVVGTALTLPAPMTLPFGASATVATVGGVTVRSTHRRRGILTRLMRAQLDGCHERGEALAGLWASEAAIYPRFGYGMGTWQGRLRIQREESAFRERLRVERVEQIDGETARRVLPALQQAAAAPHPGFMVRSDRHWNEVFYDPPARRGGASRQRFVLHHGESAPDGYACYRTRPQWGPNGERESTLEVLELHALTPEAYATLWRYCLDVDLMVRVEARHRSVDEPLRHLLADARALQMRTGDGCWLRLVDVAAALGLRRYADQDDLVLEVVDEFCPWNTGRLLLSAGGGEARVTSTRRHPDLVLDASTLAALYLGANRAVTLRWAGRLEERTPGAAERADRLFDPGATPWNPTGF